MVTIAAIQQKVDNLLNTSSASRVGTDEIKSILNDLITFVDSLDEIGLDAGLASIAGLTTAADKGIYTTASDVYATFDLTAAGRELLNDAAATNQLTTLGLSANGKSLVTAADYAAMKVLLALTIGTDVQAYNANLTTFAGIAPSANVQSILGAADYAAIKVLLALTIGTDVQAYNANLTTFAGIAPSADIQSLLAVADYAAARTALTLTTGLYNPTRSAETNLDSNASPSEAQWMRIGNMVTVSGQFTVDPTTTVTTTAFELDLPIASDIAAISDCAGAAVCGSSNEAASISGSVANNTVRFSWTAVSVASQIFSYQYMYEIK